MPCRPLPPNMLQEHCPRGRPLFAVLQLCTRWTRGPQLHNPAELVQVPLYDVLRLCAVDPALGAAGPKGLRRRVQAIQEVRCVC